MAIIKCEDKQHWDDQVNDFGGHPLQLWGWGELKSAHNWQAIRLFYESDGIIKGGAQVLVRALPGPFKALSYIPRGPYGGLGDSLTGMDELVNYLKTVVGGTLITAEPDQQSVSWGKKWRQSTNTILIPRTLILDLNQSEDELLEAMTKKTRQYIRKGERDGVVVKKVTSREDLADVLAIYRETALRANFALHGDDYYYDLFDKLGDNNLITGAYYQGRLVSFVWNAISSYTAFELYGGMNDEGQELRANYTLKWHTITKCKEWGLKRYDMNGLLNDGVSNFKIGFANHEDMLAGTYDYPLSKLYMVWSRGLPTGKKIIRKLRGK